MNKEALPWRSFTDPGSIGQGGIAARWNLSATPTLYVIDHLGVIRHKWVGSPSEDTIGKSVAKLVNEAQGSGKVPAPSK